MHGLRMTLGASGLILAIVCAALALLAQGGRISIPLDAITHLAPLLLAGAALAALLSGLGEGTARLAGLGLALVGAVAAAALIVPEFLRPLGPTAALGAPGQIKVIQFNVWRGNRNLKGITDWIVAEKPDLVFLVEATPALRDMIKARTGWSVIGSQSSVMVFTHAHYLVMNRPETPPKTLTFVNGTYASSSGPLEAMITHLSWPSTAYHTEQSQVLRKVLAQMPKDRLILSGDFNSTPWSFERRKDDVGYGLTRRDRAVPTWPTGDGPWRGPVALPFAPIDHVYAGPGWATTSVRRGPNLGSDHYPLVVTLAPVAPR